MKKKNDKNQISIFELLASEDNAEDAKVLLMSGQTVYKVVKGDVEEYLVTKEPSWTYGERERGYRLIKKNGCYDVTTNKELGVMAFMDHKSAERVAKKYRDIHDVILAEDIKLENVVAYQYTRGCDNRVLTAFYGEMENGMLYMKEFMTFHHIKKNTKNTIKKFMEQQEFQYETLKKVDYNPVLKNMYKCKQLDGWEYAEAGCSYAVG